MAVGQAETKQNFICLPPLLLKTASESNELLDELFPFKYISKHLARG